jgi:Protein of unknown function, DUF547
MTKMKPMIYHRFLLLTFIIFCGNAQAFDHEYRDYGEVLKTYSKDGLVDYAALQKNRKGIDQFVKDIGVTTRNEYESWSHDQQLAFWINTYNGWFLQIVIDRYPIRGGRLFGVLYPENSVQRIPGIWDNIKTRAAGREVSLNDIEHKILRPIFKEPRIHFAIVCASISCPVLRSEPFRASSLQGQLEDAARDFVNNPTKVRWDANEKKVEISKIFDWFSEDFASFADESWLKLYSKKQAGPVSFVSKYLPAATGETLKNGKVKVDYLDYDWHLNEQK